MNDDNWFYLEFLKRILIGSVSVSIQSEFWNAKKWPKMSFVKYIVKQPVSYAFEHGGPTWATNSHTMICLTGLNQINESLDYINLNNIEGDLLEAGVWRGGACIFMKMYCKLYNLKKKIYVCDSFQGIPAVDAAKYPQDAGMEDWSGIAAVSQKDVVNTFKHYDIQLDDSVVFVPGWFCDSLPNLQVDKLSLLRLDGDLYSSTMDVLKPLYPKVVENGVIIIDDYSWTNCAHAVNDYLTINSIEADIKNDEEPAYWIKQGETK